ncbi:NB-ARC domain-containing protein [Streptomyces sp. NBC_00035]|uniref:NB-ARC domain-containing protein n=1 Tax=Streptomyces sp. NBC_00035 TaxID=2903614 RepID=UPI003251DF03
MPENDGDLGWAKVQFCRRLGEDWHDLADLLGIPSYTQEGFPQGEKARRIWAWLEDTGRLGELPETLTRIERGDLAGLLHGHAQLLTNTRSSRRHWNVPGKPSPYVERPDVITALEASLLASTPASGARIVTLTGMAGVGKSVTARAVAEEPGVVDHFVDGVVWLYLGKKPDIQTRQNELIEALGGKVGFADQQFANARINNLMQGKSLLLVLDDVWTSEDLGAFKIHHPTVTVLVTTRDRELLQTDVEGQTLDVLDESAALALFSRHLGVTVQELTADELGIVRECAGLPLALAVAGGYVRGRRKWLAPSLLARLRGGELEFGGERWLDNYPYPSLLKALEASTDDLSPDELDCYLSLAVFKHAGTVPCAALSQFWSTKNLSEYEVQDMLVLLDGRSLLTLDADSERVTVHALLYDYIARKIESTDLRERHRALADSYLALWGGLDNNLAGLRPSPDLDQGERYGIAHLVFHLKEGGRADEMHRLLALDAARGAADDGGANVWYTVRSTMHQDKGYLKDIREAWDAAAESRATRQDAAQGESAALCLQYALITASLSSIAAKFSPWLLFRLANTGAWPVDRSMHQALKIPDATSRAEALTLLLPHLAETDVDSVITEVLTGLLNINKARLAALLGTLADRLSPEQVRTVLDAIPKIRPSANIFADVVEALLPALTEPLARLALQSGTSVTFGPYRARARAALAQFLPADERRAVLLDALCDTAYGGLPAASLRSEVRARITDALSGNMDDEEILDVLRRRSPDVRPTLRIALACAVLPLLGEANHRVVRDEALALATDLSMPFERSLSLSGLAAATRGADRDTLVGTARQAALQVPKPEFKAYALAAAAITGGDPAAFREALEAAIASARRPGDVQPRAFRLLCPHLPDELIDRAIDAAWSVRYQAGTAVWTLLHRLGEEQLRRFLLHARRVPSAPSIPYFLPMVYPFLPAALIPEALSIIESSESSADRCKMLQRIAPHLDAATAQAALELVREAEDRSQRYRAVAALAARVPPADRHRLMEETVADILASGTEKELTARIDGVGEHLDKDQLLAVTALSGTLADVHLALSSLTTLMPFGTAGRRASLLASATGLVPRISSPALRIRCLVDLSFVLPPTQRDPLLSDALTALEQVRSSGERLALVLTIVSATSPTTRPRALSSALTALASVREPRLRAEAAAALLALIRRTPGPEPTETIAALEAHAEVNATAPPAPERSTAARFNGRITGLPELKLALAMAVTDEERRARELADVAAVLSPALVPEAAAGARHLEDRALRAQTLHAMADSVRGPQRNALLAEAYENRLSLQDRSSHIRVAANFLPLAPARVQLPTSYSLLQSAEALEDALGKCRAVTALARVVPPPLTGFVLHTARRISVTSMRVHAVAAVCPRLPSRVASRAAVETVTAVAEREDPLTAAQALAKLSFVLEEAERGRIGRRILDAALGLGSDRLKVASCAQLAEVDSPSLAESLVKVAKKFDDASMALVLARLRGQVGPAERAFALAHVREIANPKERALAVRRLIPDTQDVDHVLEIIEGLSEQHHLQGVLLAELAPGRAPAVQARIMDAAMRIVRPGPRVTTVMAVAPLLHDEAELLELQGRLLVTCKEIKKRAERTLSLAALAAHARPEGRAELLAEVLVECLTLDNARNRADHVVQAGRTLADLPDKDRSVLLDSALRRATDKGRSAIVSCLPLLVPLMLSEGGDATVPRSARAVADAFRWWA